MPSVGRNIIFNVAGQTCALLLGLVAVRYIYRDLGDDAVGLIFFALTLNSVLTAVLDLGMSSTIVREVAGRADASSSSMQALLRTAALVYWTLYILLATAIVLLAGVIARHWLNVGAMDLGVAEASLQVLGVGSLLALPKSLYSSLFKGLQRMGVSNVIDTVSAGIQQLGIATTIAWGGGVTAVSWWIAGSTAAGLLVYVVAAARIVPVRALLPGLDAETVRGNLPYASRMAVVSVLAMIHTNADKLIVSRLLPLGVFGLYGFAFSAINRGMLLTGAVTQAAFPSLAALERSGDRKALIDQFWRLQDLVSFATAAVFAAAAFAARPICTVLFGASEAAQMVLPWTFLAIGFYMNSTLNIPYVLSLAMGKPGIPLALNTWALAVVLPVTVLLVWSLGLIGAALSWLVYHVFAYWYVVPRIARECIGSTSLAWYLGVAKFMFPAAAIYGTAWLAAEVATGGSAAGFGAAYAAGTALYAAVGWKALSAGARDRIRSIALAWNRSR